MLAIILMIISAIFIASALILAYKDRTTLSKTQTEIIKEWSD